MFIDSKLKFMVAYEFNPETNMLFVNIFNDL